MAELPSPFTCDVCGVHKKEQNHWFRVWKNEYGTVCIASWPGHQFMNPCFHCCGEEHALRKAAELLGKLKGGSQQGSTGVVRSSETESAT